MEKIVSKNKCTGCTACKNICPKEAIEMVEDKNGFKYPLIDSEKCINCGLCQKICPVKNTVKNESINKCYVGYANDETIKENASSGGIFPIIANNVLKKNGIVIGAAFDDDNKLNHIAITNKNDLEKLKGSKYLQSDLSDIYTYVKNNINDKLILFVGVPCQVAGLKAFLKKEYDNLICIDLICHGVPSPKIFKNYIKELERKNKDKLLDYNFRDKSTGWDTYSNTMTFQNYIKTELASKNQYMKIFLSDIGLRDSCFECNFKLGNKYSDITLGDFWGVKNYYPDMYNKNGVSAIIINTEKGKNIFDCINSKLIFKECNIEEITSGNTSLKCSNSIPKNRQEFFDDLDKMNFDKLVKKYTNQKSFSRRVLGRCQRIIKKFFD